LVGPALISTLYPIELEPREGTQWLHPLALSHGVNIFDPAVVAYINMNHGPIDSIVKSLIISVFPFAPASFVTRFFCILLPILILALSIFVLRYKSFRIWKSLALTVLTYGVIVMDPTYGSFVGRSDPTALVFGFLAATVMLSHIYSTRPRLYLYGLAGLLLSLMVLTNWRF